MQTLLAYARSSALLVAACALLANSAQSDPTDTSSHAAQGNAAKNADQGAVARAAAPQRQAGWWEFTSALQSGKSAGSEHLCVGPASESKYSAFDQIVDATSLGGGQCSKREFVQKNGSWSFDLACVTSIPAEFGGGASTNTGTITGNIQTNYVIHQTITMSSVTRTGTINAALKGICPADRKEGDKVVGEGESSVVVSVLD